MRDNTINQENKNQEAREVRYYENACKKLEPYFLKHVFVETRIQVGEEWENFLLKSIRGVENEETEISKIVVISAEVSDAAFNRIKEINAVTEEWEKAIEIYINEKLKEIGKEELSVDDNLFDISDNTKAENIIMIKKALDEVWIPAADALIVLLTTKAVEADYVNKNQLKPKNQSDEISFGEFSNRFKEAIETIKSIVDANNGMRLFNDALHDLSRKTGGRFKKEEANSLLEMEDFQKTKKYLEISLAEILYEISKIKNLEN